MNHAMKITIFTGLLNAKKKNISKALDVPTEMPCPCGYQLMMNVVGDLPN